MNRRQLHRKQRTKDGRKLIDSQEPSMIKMEVEHLLQKAPRSEE
jgi:hypothetical protein